MKLRSIIFSYARSPLSILVLGITATAAGILGFSGILGTAEAIGSGSILYIVISTVLLFNPGGAKAVAGENERKRSVHDSEALDAAKKNRDALSFMRIADPEIKKASQALLLAADKYLEAALKTSCRDPECENALAEARDIVDTFLKGMDAEAAEKHYGLSSDLNETDFKAKIIDLLKAKAETLNGRAAAIRGEINPADAVDIKKELS